MPNIYSAVRITWKNFLGSLPVICFFLFLFYTILFLFGTQYIMIVSLVTVLFQTSYRKRKSWKNLTEMAATQLLMSVFAFLATLSPALSVVLNLTVPFGLIFYKVSRFQKMGYFSGLMTYTFLQLLPVDLKGFFVQTAAMLYAILCFLVLVRLYQWRYPQKKDYGREIRGLQILAACLRQQLAGTAGTAGTAAGLYQLQQLQYQETYANRGRKEIATREGKISYMFALLFQRAGYFITRRYHPSMLERKGARELLEAAADYIELAASVPFWEKEYRVMLAEKGRKILAEAEGAEDGIHISVANFLDPFLIILKKFDENETVWPMPAHRTTLGKLRHQMRLDGFETRFALRMSLVLTLSFLFVECSGADHAYWLPLNAFLLLRPMYEESRYRIRTRFLGTAAGCIVISMLFPMMNSMTGHFVLASLMVACMYTATPGTFVHAVYVTCFALSMVTLAMGRTAAVELRMIYVVGAILLVLVINRFFFPTSMGGQFRYNLNMLFHLHHMHLRMLGRSLERPADYGTICDAQVEYHMVHGQMMEYLEKKQGHPFELYRRLLLISWEMAVQMEQILLFVNAQQTGPDRKEELENYIAHARYVLDQIQDMLSLQKEKTPADVRQFSGVFRKEDEECSRFLTAYAKNLSRMYREVLQEQAVMQVKK